jgi:hypothetical protein
MIDKQYKIENIKWISNLPDCFLTRKLLQTHFVDLFKYYKKLYKIKNKLIVTKKNNARLLKYCKGKTPREIKKILNGDDVLPPTMLYAKYAMEIYDQYVDENPDVRAFHVVHAICPYVIDPWNLPHARDAFCYYKLDNIPIKVSGFYACWNNIKDPLFIF